MDAKHTPGPWRFDDHPFRSYPRVTDSRGRYVADCDTEASARLIAAAPDMLGSLIAIANYAGAAYAMPEERAKALDLIQQVARGDIAKATGGA